MSSKTVQNATVETKSNKLARLRKEYLLTHWPTFINLFPGMPGFENSGVFEQKAVEMLELSKKAQVSITGMVLGEEDLERLNSRPVKDFLQHLKSNYNRTNLADQWRNVRDLYLLELDDEA